MAKTLFRDITAIVGGAGGGAGESGTSGGGRSGAAAAGTVGTAGGSQAEVLAHADILVSEDRFAWIGATGSLDPKRPGDPAFGAEVFDGRGKVAVPGFFNIHTHIPMTLLRGYGEGLPLDEWLRTKMFPFEALLTDEDSYWGSLLGIAEMLAGGTVSFTDMYMHTPGIARAVQESGIRANLAHAYAGTAIPAGAPMARFEGSRSWKGTRFLMDAARADGSGRLKADSSIHAEYTFGEPRVAAEIAEFCAREGMRMHIHLSETKKEHEACKTARGLTPVEFFDSFGIFDAPTTAAHCVWIEESDMDILAARKVTVAHCPSSNLKLGSGIAPILRMRERGIAVGLGTDGAASNNNLDALEEAALAALVQKGVSGDPLALPPRELLMMASRTGALAQGRPDCGAIAVGMKADLAVYDFNRPHLQPVYDVMANLFHAARSSDVVLTMVDGRTLYRNGEFTTMDITRVLAEASRIRTEKLERLGSGR